MPILLGRLGFVTLKSTDPFWAEFRHFAQIRDGTEPAGFDIVAIGGSPLGTLLSVVRRGNLTGRTPRLQARDELSHA